MLKTNPSVVLELLQAAANKGEIELFSLKAEPTDLLSPQWRELVSEVGGFNLVNGHGEYTFEPGLKRVGPLMPDRLDLYGASNWGWFCTIHDGEPGSVWWLCDCFCNFGFPSFQLWLEAVLQNHRAWLELWSRNGSPDIERDEEKWDQLEKEFDSQSLELSTAKHCDRKIGFKEGLLDFRDAARGECLDLRWDLSLTDEVDVFLYRRRSMFRKLKKMLTR